MNEHERYSVWDIIKQWLTDNGYDGLANVDCDCGCELTDLFPCSSEGLEMCEAGYKRMYEKNYCADCESEYCPKEEGCWCISLEKPV